MEDIVTASLHKFCVLEHGLHGSLVVVRGAALLKIMGSPAGTEVPRTEADLRSLLMNSFGDECHETLMKLKPRLPPTPSRSPITPGTPNACMDIVVIDDDDHAPSSVQTLRVQKYLRFSTRAQYETMSKEK